MIVGNFISGNAADTADAATGGPTGINLYSVAPVTGTVIIKNHFEDEGFNIVFKAPSGLVSAHLNNFSSGVGVDNMGTGAVDATENWWGCGAGPASANCASVEGSNVLFTPWLTHPFDSEFDDH
jgi:hypothetical protein